MALYSFPDPRTKDPREHFWQRLLEMVLGTLTLATFSGMLIFSYFLPIWVAVFVILFDIFWIYRTIYVAIYTVVAYRRLKEGQIIDWWEKCQRIEDPKKYYQEINQRIIQIKNTPLAGISFWEKRKIKAAIKTLKKQLAEVQQLEKTKEQIWDWRKIIHVVFLPTANESADIIEPSIQAVADSNFPNEQIIILLATEEREPEKERLEKVNYLKNKYQGVFRDFLISTHEVATGEMKCKASNATYAAKYLQKYLDERGIEYPRVIFSNFDCDSVCHPQYFAALTYAYITDPKRLQRAYQPLPMYHNNIWDTNAFVRVIVTGSSFWHMYQSTRQEMVTFSSHSEPFDTLVKVNFWPVNVISEDSIIYWKGFCYFHGDYRVTPIYLPISLDAVLAPTYWGTIKNQYKQQRRWAYGGVEDFPLLVRAAFPDKKMPWRSKLRTAFEMVEGHYTWATTSIILAVLGWLPLFLGGNKFNESVLAHNLPFITKYLMTLAMGGLVVSMFLNFLMLPPRPKKYSRKRYIYMILQWGLVPFIGVLLSSLPAIDAQARVLIKKYFGEFWVTEKIRKS